MGRAPDHVGFIVALVSVQTRRDKGLQSSVVQSMGCETACSLERGEARIPKQRVATERNPALHR
jgi:hypothetical protein